MRTAFLIFLLSATSLVVVAPFGPWVPAPFPPAASTAGDTGLFGADTIRLAAEGWRNGMPMTTTGPCGGESGDQSLHLWITFQAPQHAYLVPVVDSVWIVRGGAAMVDPHPAWDSSLGPGHLHYRGIHGLAEGDSFTVVVASPSLGNGRRYLATPVRVRTAV